MAKVFEKVKEIHISILLSLIAIVLSQTLPKAALVINCVGGMIVMKSKEDSFIHKIAFILFAAGAAITIMNRDMLLP